MGALNCLGTADTCEYPGTRRVSRLRSIVVGGVVAIGDLVCSLTASDSKTEIGDGHSQGPLVEMPAWVVATRPWMGKSFDEDAAGVFEWRGSGSGVAAETLSGELGGVTALVIQDSFGGIEAPRLSVRGSGIQSAPTNRGIDMRWDGLPLGLADGSFQSLWLVPGLAQGGSLKRGVTGLADGAGTMGGVLDLKGLPCHGKRELRAEAGAGGYWNAKGVWRGKEVGGNALVAVQGQGRDGYREHDRQDRTMAYGRVEFGEGVVSLLCGRASYEVPGPLTYAKALSEPESVSAEVQRDEPHRESLMGRLAAQGKGTVCGATWRAGVSLQHSEDTFCQLRTNGQSQSVSDDIGLVAGVSGQCVSGGLGQQWSLRIMALEGWRSLERRMRQDGVEGARFADDTLRATTLTAVVENRIRVGKPLTVRVGVAAIGTVRRGADRLHNGQPDFRWSTWRGAPHVMFDWKTAGDVLLYVGWYRCAESPTFDDLMVVEGAANRLVRSIQNLGTQTASVYEAGVMGRFGILGWDACLYRGSWNGELLKLADAQGASLGTRNAEETIHEGFEMVVRTDGARDFPRLVAEAKSVWQRARFEGDRVFGDRTLGGVPRWVGRGLLRGEMRSGWHVSTEVEWRAGTTWADHAGKLGYGGTTLWTMRLGRRHIWGGWHVSVKNILDRANIASTAGVLDLARRPENVSLFLPGPGRTWNCGIDWLF